MSQVLIADDVADMRNLLAQIVESAGHKAIQAKNGDQLLEILKDDQITVDLIFLDIEMPRLNGIQAMNLIRDLNLDAKVCFVSGASDKSIVSKAIQAGGDDYVVKPIDVSILIQKMNNLLGGEKKETFTWLETNLKAKFSSMPIDLELKVVKLSEEGLIFECPMPIKVGQRVEIEIPGLNTLLNKEVTMQCAIGQVSIVEGNIFVCTCSFFGDHENLRSQIRSLTIKGTALSD